MRLSRNDRLRNLVDNNRLESEIERHLEDQHRRSKPHDKDRLTLHSYYRPRRRKNAPTDRHGGLFPQMWILYERDDHSDEPARNPRETSIQALMPARQLVIQSRCLARSPGSACRVTLPAGDPNQDLGQTVENVTNLCTFGALRATTWEPDDVKIISILQIHFCLFNFENV
jgi:hypothetical protein